MKLSAGLGSSKLEAKGGIIGGSIELQELNTQGMKYANALLGCNILGIDLYRVY